MSKDTSGRSKLNLGREAMTTEAERLLRAAHAWENNLTQLGPDMVSPQMLRDAAAEIERLKSEAELFAKHTGLTLAAKDTLLRQALEALESCAKGGYIDIDGDWARTFWYDSEKVETSVRAIKQHLGEV